MKSIFPNCTALLQRFCMLSLLLILSSVSYGISVTFRVDMTHYMAMGFFNPSKHNVYVVGEFNNWAFDNPLTRQTGSNIYSTTLSVASNASYEFKFFNNGTSSYDDTYIDSFEEMVGSGKNGNRILKTGTSDIVLPTVLYSNYRPGNEISKQQAETIAKNWFKHWNPNKNATTDISGYSFEMQFNQPFSHVFNFSQGGWVAISATDRLRPIVGYNFINSAQGMGISAFMSHLADVVSDDVLDEWDDLYRNDFSRYSSHQVLPLVTSHWHQWWPYNAYYPLNPVYYVEENGRYRLGCTITAAAQMMKYWNYPESGKGIVYLNDPVTGLNYHDLSKDHFQWYNMPDFLDKDTSLTEEVYGPSALVNYSFWTTVQHATGEGYSNWNTSWAVHFGYSPTAEVIQEWSFTPEEWQAIYNNELDNGRPIMMAGSGDTWGQGGHAFICDGYQADSYYHVNLGWAHINGYLDGFYPFNNFAGHNYNHVASIGFQPAYCKPNFIKEYQPDGNTVLLMHFNDNLNNASSVGGSAVTNGSGISFANNDSLPLGKCLRIDNSSVGKNSFLSVAHNSALNFENDWTIEAWVYINSWDKDVNRNPFLFMKSNNDWSKINYKIQLNTSDSSLWYEYRPSGDKTISFDAQHSFLQPHRWYHIALIRKTETKNTSLLVYDSNNELVYFRSQPYNAKEGWGPGINEGNLFIGSWGGNNWGLFDGYIDELRISNVARTIDEVAGVVYAANYPGDADNNGQVKADDVLPLGFFYGQTGEPREEALQGCSWQLNNRIPWDNFRATYADCNGDGTVNSEDILCLGYNYNKISPINKSQSILKSVSSAILSISPLPNISQLHEGDEVDVTINIENGCDITGTSFDLLWDPDQLEIEGNNYLMPGEIWESNPLLVKKLDADQGRIEIGISNKQGKTLLNDGSVIGIKMRLKKPDIPGLSIDNPIGMNNRGEKVQLLATSLLTTNSITATPDAKLRSFPNPFSGITQIQFTIADQQKCSLNVYNSLGQLVCSLVDRKMVDAGSHSFQWDSEGSPKGVYLCKLETGKGVFTLKLVLK